MIEQNKRPSNFPALFQALADNIDKNSTEWDRLITKIKAMPFLSSYTWHECTAPVPFNLFVCRRPIGGNCFEIDRRATLLVGFIRLENSTDANELQLEIGRKDFGKVCLSKSTGSFVFAHIDRFVVPLINLFYHDVRVHDQSDDKSIGIVYANLDPVEQQELFFSSACSDSDIDGITLYMFGMGGTGQYNKNTYKNPIQLPDMQDLLNGPKERSVARCDALREELMAAAWHPKRFRKWCLEYDDEFSEASCQGLRPLATQDHMPKNI